MRSNSFTCVLPCNRKSKKTKKEEENKEENKEEEEERDRGRQGVHRQFYSLVFFDLLTNKLLVDKNQTRKVDEK